MLAGVELPKTHHPEVIKFHSRSELAIGVLLEQFVPGFYLEAGKTFQVPIGYNRTCDFLVNGVFFEFHPITLKYEFSNREEFWRLSRLMDKMRSDQAKELKSILTEELFQKYYEKRRLVITASFGADTELVVAQNEEDVYKTIIRRFAPNPPGLKRFNELFQAALKCEQMYESVRRKQNK